MSTQEFIAAARRCLCVGRKSLSGPLSLDLAAQVSAVDLGLKPTLLYDMNGAGAEQLQQYLKALQSLGLVSNSLLTLDLNGNSLIVNSSAVKSSLKSFLHDGSVSVIDVCHSLEEPVITDLQRREVMRTVARELLGLLEEFLQLKEAEKPLYVGQKSEEWNLCTVFGLLLGYPAVYWFNQSEGFDNCLSMTPLMVIKASAVWRQDRVNHSFGLYSFSIPANLQEETRSDLEKWKISLQERFEQQQVLKDLSLSQSTATLPSVCL